MCCCVVQARQESAARAVLEAAKKAGAAGELLSQRELQAVFQSALNPPKEALAAGSRVSAQSRGQGLFLFIHLSVTFAWF